MQGLIFDIKRFAIHDGPGVRTTVFMKGCPLQCRWCHNPEGISPNIESSKQLNRIGDKTFESEQIIGRSISTDELLIEILKEKVFMEEGRGGVTFSGGEPLFQPEFLLAMLKLCKQEGLHTVVDTSGYATDKVVTQILPFVDLFLFDIKAASSNLHEQYTGVKNSLVLNNLKVLIHHKSKVIVRIPIITGVNDGLQEILAVKDKLKELQSESFNEIHLLPYHKLGAAKYEKYRPNFKMMQVNEPTYELLEQIAEVFKNEEFNVLIHS